MNGWRVQDALSGRRRDYYGGALMVLLGLGAVVIGRDYKIGSLTQMGSGFFPVALGVILVLIGIAIAATAGQPTGGRPTLHEGATPEAGQGPEWRGWFCILAGVLAFIILGQWGGLVIATFAVTFISALGDRDNSLVAALALAIAITIVSVVVFWWALQIQFPLFSWG
jgi:hypothetical protein